MKIESIQIIPFGRGHAQTCKQLQKLQPDDFEKSIDKGGHGGTLKLKGLVNGETIFLKPIPKDEAEARNYQIIIQTNPEVAKWMPTVFGKIEVNGTWYLAMKNIRKSPEGADLKQLLDIKLAGKVPSLENAIGSSSEMKVTRGKKKSVPTDLWMRFTSMLAPGYLAMKGGVRLFDYIRSETLLEKTLKPLSREHLRKLQEDLLAMRRDIEKSDIAFIGASIALIRQQDGSVKPILLDPAHIQCHDRMMSQVTRILGKKDAEKIYFESSSHKKTNQYPLFKRSNIVALESLIATVSDTLAVRDSKEIRIDAETPQETH